MKKLFLLLTALLCLAVTSVAQNVTVTGVVVDGASEEPLTGATVMPIGGGQGTSTDLDGRFTLKIPASVKQVKVSYVGYKTATVSVAPQMTVKLDVDNRLDEVVVTGYGSAKKLGSIVGAVSVVGSEQFENVPTATFLDALQGQVAGLSIMSASGDPSSDETTIRMRGVNSISAGNTPLFILDGAPITQAVFTTLNPTDIESVTVLKDAASVAIYGSRAANGVIVITSKKGKFGEAARVNIRASYGWSQMTPDKVKMMTSQEYVKYRELIGNPVSDEILHVVNDLGISTNWRDEIFDSSAPTYNIDAAVSGGSENLSYYLSLNHYESDGIIAQSHMRRETLRFSLNTRVTDWFRVGLQSNLGYTKYQQNNESNAVYSGSGIYGTNPMYFSRIALPYDSPYYYTIDPETGKPIFGERAKYLHYSNMPTPQAVMETRNPYRKNVTANVTLSEQINPIKGLTLRAQQNVDAFDYRLSNYAYPTENIVTPMGDVYTWGGSNTGINQQSFQRYYAFTYTNTAEYNVTFNDLHDLTFLLGQESIVSKSEMFAAVGEGYTDIRTMLLGQAPEVSPSDLSQSITQTAFNSYFLNASYNFDSRYFVEATVRRDGSSKFAPKHRWSTFYSFGGMWNAKAEAFLAPYTWLNDLKLHISYGTTGNSSISNYMFYGLIGAGTTYNGGQSTGIAQAENVDLTWETVRSFDVGVDFGFGNFVNGAVNFYNKMTCDMLMTIPYSYTTGYSSGFGNVGNMRNRGVDVDLTFDVIKNRDWYWGIRANFNYNQNRITKLFDGQDALTLPDAGVEYRVGHSAGELYAVEWAGIDPRDGQQMWYDIDGNLTKVYNEERDSKLTGKSEYAPYAGGFGTELRWKGLSLKVDFNWAAEKYMINNDRYFVENNNMSATRNQMNTMLNVWTTPGQITDIPAADGQVLQFDTHLIEDASFLRLKNLTLQYSLPQNILNKLHLRGLTAHFTGRNLLTFTGYTGYDPEPETNVVAFFYPNTRQYEFGIEVSF
ncbi:MAG: TonB-dependent receptor [Muribaculaceae bacterium]|nr:TonB-dependent receptor [Muribaculaceae bacterium]